MKSNEKSLLKDVCGGILYILVILALTYFVITFIGQRTKVDGNSMEPTLSNGDNLIVDKLSYRFRDPSRFDVIIFPYPHADHVYYIKRIIGLPGDAVQVKEDGCVYINGSLLDEHFGAEPMLQGGIAAQELTLGEDEYFVLGDNRNHSSDSRDPMVGIIKGEDIIGRAWVRIYPFDKMGIVKHE